MHQQLFFHQSEVQKEPGQALAPGTEVSFSLAADTQGKGEGNPMAIHVQLLPEGTLEVEKRLPGSFPQTLYFSSACTMYYAECAWSVTGPSACVQSLQRHLCMLRGDTTYLSPLLASSGRCCCIYVSTLGVTRLSHRKWFQDTTVSLA